MSTVLEKYYSLISPRNISNVSLAKSLPPIPNAMPPAIANIAIRPVNIVAKYIVGTPNFSIAVKKPTIYIAHLAKAEVI